MTPERRAEIEAIASGERAPLNNMWRTEAEPLYSALSDLLEEIARLEANEPDYHTDTQ